MLLGPGGSPRAAPGGAVRVRDLDKQGTGLSGYARRGATSQTRCGKVNSLHQEREAALNEAQGRSRRAELNDPRGMRESGPMERAQAQVARAAARRF
jgi:hypothetical protein